MKKIALVCFWFFGLYGVRDPFFACKHSYHYTAYGLVHATDEALGVVWIDGTSYCVRVGTCVVGHTVHALSAERALLYDERGDEWNVTKNPST